MSAKLNYIPASITEYSNSFKRQTNNPLDSTSVLYSCYNYKGEVKGEGYNLHKTISDYIALSGVAYVGQIFSGYDSIANAYIIKNTSSYAKILDDDNIKTFSISTSGNISANIIGANSFAGDGRSITNINASNITSGTLTMDRHYKNSSLPPDNDSSLTYFSRSLDSGKAISSINFSRDEKGHLIDVSIDSSAPQVYQEYSATTYNLDILLSYNASNTSNYIACTRKSNLLKFNPSTALLTVGGTGAATDSVLISTRGRIQAGSFSASSDARLKENFVPLQINKSILDLPVYKFDFINGAKNQIGCKAQDLREICPEIVNENDDGYLSIQESKIVYLLLEEVKKLSEKVEYLERLLDEKR